MSPRRQLAAAVALCAAGGALVLFATSRAWTAAPAPRPGLVADDARTGAEVVSWLPALAWVALAGAGALLATRGTVRGGVGGLLVLAGVGAAVGAGLGGGEAAAAGGGWGWPAATVSGAVAVVVAGTVALVGSRRWPAMGARYERVPAGRPAERTTEQLWQALDRGEDPTA